MPVTRVKSKWVDGNLIFTTNEGVEIARFDYAAGSLSMRRKVAVHVASATLVKEDSGSLLTNLGATGAVVLTLPQDAPIGTEFTAVVSAAQVLSLDPGAAGGIYIAGAKQADNKTISADDEAESVTLTALGTGDWLASGATGTWTVES